MKFIEYLEKWELETIKVNIGFLEAELSFNKSDKRAAWELYVELLTRITTQPLPNNLGIEKTALQSIYSLFGITREILRNNGRSCIQFSKIAIIILNQIIRPFTTKWHIKENNTLFADKNVCNEFRRDLEELRIKLLHYAGLLSDIAEVENLSEIEYNS